MQIEPTSSTSSRPSARNISISLTSSSLVPPHAKGGQENNLTGVISGVIVVVIVIILLIIILITSVLILKRRKKGSMKLLNINSIGQSNPVYLSDTLVKETRGLDIPLINPVSCVIYEEPGKAENNAQTDFYSEAVMTIHTVTNAMYGMNSPQSTNLSCHITIYSHCLLYIYPVTV